MQGELFVMLSLYFLIRSQPILITGTNFEWFLSHFNLFFTLNVAVFRSKILTTLIYRGKNFGGVFFDVFRKSEQESEKIMTVDTLFAEIPNLWALLVHNCKSVTPSMAKSTTLTIYPTSNPKTGNRFIFIIVPDTLDLGDFVEEPNTLHSFVYKQLVRFVWGI